MVHWQCSERVLAPLQPPAQLSNFGLQPWTKLPQNLYGEGKNVHEECVKYNTSHQQHVKGTSTSAKWGGYLVCLICSQNTLKIYARTLLPI